MSSLTKLKNPVPQKVVEVSDEEGFVVRGLNPAAVFTLYYRHTGEIGQLFEKFLALAQGDGEAKLEDAGSIVVTLLQNAPLILAELIALAAGADPVNDDEWLESVGIARDLSFPVQVDALEKIGALTFTSEMPVGKFAALVAKSAQAMTSAAAPYLRA